MSHPLIILLLFISLHPFCLSCACPETNPSTPTDFPQIPPSKLPSLTIDGVDYGRSYYFNKYLYLGKEIEASDKNERYFYSPCPDGYQTFTTSFFNSLKTSLGDTYYEDFIDADQFNLDPDKVYITTTSSSTTGNYNVIRISKKNKTVTVDNVPLKELPSKVYAKCFALMEKITYSMTVQNGKTAVKGKTGTYNIYPNVFDSAVWKFENVMYTSPVFTKRFQNAKCSTLELWVKFKDDIQYICQPIYIDEPFYFNVNSKFSLSKIRTIETDILPRKFHQIFFRPSTAPSAAKVNEPGFYVAYAHVNAPHNLHILDFDGDFKLVRDVDLGIPGFVLDIAGTYWGFVLLVSTTDQWNEYLYGFHADGTLRFKRTIFHNHSYPKVLKEQIAYYRFENHQIFGIAAMSEAENGRVVFANGRIGVVFAHYNNFEEGVDYDGHTGDTFVTLDENGNDVTWSFAWGASHSLCQSLLYDGTRFVYAALGDAYPENIRVCYMDPFDKHTLKDIYNGRYYSFQSECKDEVYPNKMKGDHGGNSSGRLGALLFNGERYAVVYSVKGLKDEQEGEFGVMTFKIKGKMELEEFRKVKIENVDPNQIIQVRAGKYGKNILIMYVNSNTELKDDVMPPYRGYAYPNQTHYVFVNFFGEIISGPFTQEGMTMSLMEDFTELNNGALVWTSFNHTAAQGKLKIHYLDPLV